MENIINCDNKDMMFKSHSKTILKLFQKIEILNYFNLCLDMWLYHNNKIIQR